MAKFTLGPWKIITEDGNVDRIMKIVANDKPIMSSEQYYPEVPKNVSDWTLIAAAPNLHDTCQGMGERLREYVAELRKDGMNGEANNIERIANTLLNAAAKARGEGGG